MRRTIVMLFFSLGLLAQMRASVMLLPMDETSQRDHLKAYGITYWVISQGVEAYWLLNYRGAVLHLPIPRYSKRNVKPGM